MIFQQWRRLVEVRHPAEDLDWRLWLTIEYEIFFFWYFLFTLFISVIFFKGHDTEPRVIIQHEKEHQRELESRKRKGMWTIKILWHMVSIFLSKFLAEEMEKSQSTSQLDQIFKRTTTQPSLYYLPLSDAEVFYRFINFNLYED